MNQSITPIIATIITLAISFSPANNVVADDAVAVPVAAAVPSSLFATEASGDSRAATPAVNAVRADIQPSELDALEVVFLAQSDYTVKPKDILQVIVYGEPEMSKESVRVSIDGNVNLPLIGNVYVQGLAISDVEKKIESLLRDGYLLRKLFTSVEASLSITGLCLFTNSR